MKEEQYNAMLGRFVAAIKAWNATHGRGKFNLAQINVNIDGRAQVQFSDPDTDNAWIGFQMAEAMRGAPVAEVGADAVFLLRRPATGERWPVGMKLYA